jgi:predicted GTPase
LSRADSVYPVNEWDHLNMQPSQQQRLSLAAISAKVAGLFPSSFPVQSVSALSGWNLHEFVALMVHALPARATSAVFSHFRQENCSAQTKQHAKESFAEAIKNSFDEAVSTADLPSWLMLLLHRVKRKIVALLVSLWSSFF